MLPINDETLVAHRCMSAEMRAIFTEFKALLLFFLTPLHKQVESNQVVMEE
jgi:hypothetical protein